MIVTSSLNYFFQVDGHFGGITFPVRESYYLVSDTLILTCQRRRCSHSVELYSLSPPFTEANCGSPAFIVPQKESGVKSMMGLEVRKEQEIENMVTILKQIELPDILLLTRDANTLLMRQKESENMEKEVV